MVKSKIDAYLSFLQNEDNRPEILKEIAVMGTLSGIMYATLILKYSSDLFSNYLTKAGRECNHLQGASKNLCIVDFKIRGLNLQKNTLSSKMNECNKSFNSQKCRDKVKEKIDKINLQLRDLNQHKNIFRDKARQERQAQMRVM